MRHLRFATVAGKAGAPESANAASPRFAGPQRTVKRFACPCLNCDNLNHSFLTLRCAFDRQGIQGGASGPAARWHQLVQWLSMRTLGACRPRPRPTHNEEVAQRPGYLSAMGCNSNLVPSVSSCNLKRRLSFLFLRPYLILHEDSSPYRLKIQSTISYNAGPYTGPISVMMLTACSLKSVAVVGINEWFNPSYSRKVTLSRPASSS